MRLASGIAPVRRDARRRRAGGPRRRRLGVERLVAPARRGAAGAAAAAGRARARRADRARGAALATRGGARVLGRDDIGQLAPGHGGRRGRVRPRTTSASRAPATIRSPRSCSARRRARGCRSWTGARSCAMAESRPSIRGRWSSGTTDSRERSCASPFSLLGGLELRDVLCGVLVAAACRHAIPAERLALVFFHAFSALVDVPSWNIASVLPAFADFRYRSTAAGRSRNTPRPFSRLQARFRIPHALPASAALR